MEGLGENWNYLKRENVHPEWRALGKKGEARDTGWRRGLSWQSPQRRYRAAGRGHHPESMRGRKSHSGIHKTKIIMKWVQGHRLPPLGPAHPPPQEPLKSRVCYTDRRGSSWPKNHTKPLKRQSVLEMRGQPLHLCKSYLLNTRRKTKTRTQKWKT